MDVTVTVLLHTEPLLLHKTSMRHRSLSERLLGIYTTKTLQSPGGMSWGEDVYYLHEKLDQLWIRGMVQDGPASKSGNICVGDCLLTVEGYVISSRNVEGILANLTGVRKIHVTVMRCYNQPIIMNNAVLMTNPLIRDLWRPLTSSSPQVSVLFRDASRGDKKNLKESVCYSYLSDSPDLLNLCGVYVNLMRCAEDVSHTDLCRTVIKCEKSLYTIETHKLDQGDQFILAFPLLRSHARWDTVLSEVLAVIRFCYGSPREAVMSRTNHTELDRIFLHLSRHMADTASESHDTGTMCTDLGADLIRNIDIKYSERVYIDCCLTDLEATSVHQMLEFPEDMTRTYSVVGSAIFFKNSLVCGHLHSDLLRDLHRYLHYFGIFKMATINPWQQLVFWKRIYPVIDHETGFSPLSIDSSCYALTISMDSMVLSLLLEAEDTSLWTSEANEFYTQQMLLTLHQIHTLAIIPRYNHRQSGFMQDTSLSKQPPPYNKSWLRGRSKSSNSLPSSLRLKYNELNKLIATRCSSDSMDLTFPLSPSCNRLHSDVIRTANQLPPFMHYIHLDVTDGIFIDHHLAHSQYNYRQVVACFSDTVQQIMRSFRHKPRSTTHTSERDHNDNVVTHPDRSCAITECGAMFECHMDAALRLRDNDSPVLFWVIGRRMLEPCTREIYVCYPEGLPESVVESAFCIDTIH